MHKRYVLGISQESMHSVRVRKRLGLELYEMLSRGGLGSGRKKKIGEWARVCR